jgi:hypothetical protein
MEVSVEPRAIQGIRACRATLVRLECKVIREHKVTLVIQEQLATRVPKVELVTQLAQEPQVSKERQEPLAYKVIQD